MTSTKFDHLFKDSVLGHPAGLIVLFFTEMWERFSFYGMRVLLINFLTMTLVGFNPGWEWSAENAGALFGTYAMLLYITPIIGGVIADKLTGYRIAVVIGSIIMTLGHASMAFETELSLYMGLALLVIGTGFFKPNITSIISEMYAEKPEKKDGAYTIFYMGVNAGAFFGMMLCGYLAEKIGWSWGFGFAGIFMLLGTLQFWLAKPIFGGIGDKKKVNSPLETSQHENTDQDIEKPNPFTLVDKILIAICSVIGFGYAINDPLSKIGGIDLFSVFKIGSVSGQYVAVLFALALFLFLVISRISRYTKVIRDRMIAFIVFAFFTVFFWMSFEQGASSLVIFARDYIQRELLGNAAIAFNVINAALTLIPLLIITWVLYLLAKQTGKKIMGSNITLIVCFLGVWAVVVWMLNRDFNTKAYKVTYSQMVDGALTQKQTIIGVPNKLLNVGEEVQIIKKNKEGTSFAMIEGERLQKAIQKAQDLGTDNQIIQAKVTEVKNSWVEITVSWFSILNSFFIIVFASFFSKWWDSKYNPDAAVKYGLGLIITAIGFGFLAFGSFGLEQGMKASMIWLILAYLFHTLGELCLSPVGLSYVSKLVPARMIAFMFGMWYLAIAIGNKLAAVVGGQIEKITEHYSLATFFLIFTIVPFLAGAIVIALNPALKKLMHGVK